MTIKWEGDKLKKKLDAIIAFELNETARLAKIHALNHHPNWQYRFGLAEGSIDVKEMATPKKRRVLWGSVWPHPFNNYVWYLEFKHGPFLRGAADAIYPSLIKRIKERFG